MMINERINISIRAPVDLLLFIRRNRSLESCFMRFYIDGKKENKEDSLLENSKKFEKIPPNISSDRELQL